MMGILGDKKKVITQILGSDPRDIKEGASVEDALSIIAGELMEALNSGDAKSVAQAMRSAVAEIQNQANKPSEQIAETPPVEG